MTAKVQPVEVIKDEQLSDALSERYLNYAMSTIMDRALPDVRDGLKPVHRRLMFAMRELKLHPKSGFKKCARVVGDVMGKFHPHGDSAIYGAMVRLAQDFSVRYPLVDGQGNFGNIDGDGAAAMRYTEARLTRVAEILMEGLDDNAVDFTPTYDGLDQEPLVMPAGFPNLLANGQMGIAVGMATNIPPHNLDELCDALVYLQNHPNAEVSRLVDFVSGPDFPTGGLLIDSKETIISNYEKGQGSFTIRAKWEKEDLQYGNYQIVVTEIPYQVQKSRLIEKVAELLEERKLPLMVDIRDESAEDLRIVIEPRNRTTDPQLVMAHLFKLTEFESKFNMNLNVLDKNHVPYVMSLKDALMHYSDHRRDVLVRVTEYRLSKIAHRLEVLGGHLVAYLNIDEVIKIIRDNDEPKPILMSRFQLSEIQADAILNMRLRSLRRLEEMEIQKEDQALRAEQKELNDLLGSDEKISSKLIEEFKALKKEFSKKTDLGRRMTEITEVCEDIEVCAEQFIEKEPITVVMSEKGWIRALKGHSDLDAGFAFKDGDKQRFAFHAQTTDKLLVLADDGKVYTLGADKLPRGRGFGEPLSLMIDLGAAYIVDLFIHHPNSQLLIASTLGHGFVVDSDTLIAQTRTGKTVLNLPEGSKPALMTLINEGDDRVAVLGSHRSLLIFNLDELPNLSRGKGVILQKYRDAKTKLADVMTFKAEDGFYWETGRGKTVVKDFRMWQGKRASAGHAPPAGFPKSNRFKS